MMRRVQGFSLIEVLVVVSVIAVLAAMILVGSGVLRRQALRERTARILQVVHHGLALARAERGGVTAAAQHPLAGSVPPRSQFIRAGGAPVDTAAAWPYVGVAPGVLPAAAEARLLLPDDHFADLASPLLYGMTRSRLGVLGAPLPEVSGHLQVTSSSGLAPRVATLVAPGAERDGLTVSADPGAIVVTGPLRVDNQGGADHTTAERRLVLMRQYFATVFGSVDIAAELARLGGIWAPDDDDPAHHLLAGRLWSPDAAGVRVEFSASTVLISGAPVRYRLRGPALYDAWGREILYSLDDAGGISLESAGPDGHFRWRPNPSGVLTTAANATAPSGDDHDATRDNLREGGGFP